MSVRRLHSSNGQGSAVAHSAKQPAMLWIASVSGSMDVASREYKLTTRYEVHFPPRNVRFGSHLLQAPRHSCQCADIRKAPSWAIASRNSFATCILLRRKPLHRHRSCLPACPESLHISVAHHSSMSMRPRANSCRSNRHSPPSLPTLVALGKLQVRIIYALSSHGPH